MIRNYLTIAFRNLTRNKIYSVINIVGLSIGLTCTMLIMLYVKDETSYDRFHNNVGNIYRIVAEGVDANGKSSGRKDGNTGFLQGPRFTENVPEIASFVRVQSGYENIKLGTDVIGKDILYADSNFFNVFSFPLLAGNPTTCLRDPYAVVLSVDEAKKHFGTVDAIGKTIMVKKGDVFETYTVTAISGKTPQNSSIKFDMLMPFITPVEELNRSENWFNFFLNTFIVLKPGASVASAEKNMQRFYANDSKEALKIITEKFGPVDWGAKYLLQPFTDMHLSTELPAQNGLSDASNPVYSYILTGIAILILLIACINFINLTIARSVRRAKEIGIRKVVGGERKQLIFQFLGESLLLCGIAFLLAIVLVQLVLPTFNTLSNKALALNYLIDAKLIAGYTLLFLITGFLAGFYPALILSNYSPSDTLYSRFMIAGKNYLQRSLVVFQFSLASFLIIATLIIYSQFNYLTTTELGYDDSNLVMLTKQSLQRSELALLNDELKKQPGIISIAAKNQGGWRTAAKVNGDSSMQFSYETIDENYLPMLRIAIIQGRNFSKDFPSDSTHSVIVNESFVKKAGWKNPVGEEVNFWYNNNEKYRVIGVVKDYHFESLNREITPQLFTMKASNEYGVALIKIKPGSEKESLDHIQATFRKLFPLFPYQYVFKNEENKRNYEAEAKWKQIMLFSAILTIFISCIGLFGLSVLAAEKRTKEIGIRKVLGASVNHVASILSKDFLKLVAIALVIAIPTAWIVANKWLENYPYRIEVSWKIFVLAAIMVNVIAMATVSFQAIKAALANPVESLRTE
jgi:putative ABC transport system permease protein